LKQLRDTIQQELNERGSSQSLLQQLLPVIEVGCIARVVCVYVYMCVRMFACEYVCVRICVLWYASISGLYQLLRLLCLLDVQGPSRLLPVLASTGKETALVVAFHFFHSKQVVDLSSLLALLTTRARQSRTELVYTECV
jgi:hypothetical protein